MALVLNVLSATFLFAAVFVGAMNWVYLFAGLRSKAAGAEKHTSMVYLVAQILAALGAMFSSKASVEAWLSFYVFLGVALTDPALFSLLYSLWKLLILKQRT